MSPVRSRCASTSASPYRWIGHTLTTTATAAAADLRILEIIVESLRGSRPMLGTGAASGNHACRAVGHRMNAPPRSAELRCVVEVVRSADDAVDGVEDGAIVRVIDAATGETAGPTKRRFSGFRCLETSHGGGGGIRTHGGY